MHIYGEVCVCLVLMCFDSESPGIEAIINAMRNHAEVSSVQLAACRALQHLAKCHNLHEKITAAGGIECLIASLKYHGDNHSIQVAACY